MDGELLNKLSAAVRGRLKPDEPLSAHTSFRIGGPCAAMAFPSSAEEVTSAVSVLKEYNAAHFVMGSGTNLLVADNGFRGAVINMTKFSSVTVDGRFIRAAAGTPLPKLASEAAKAGLSGLAFAHGIPGSVGGAVCMNAGAYGGEMKQVVAETAVLGEDGEVFLLDAAGHRFGYRESIFMSNPGWVALETVFALEPGDSGEIRKEMRDLAAKRRSSQPLDLPSAGSVFKRPALRPGGEQLYAAKLIDDCGLKGLTVGGAAVSEKHAGFIVNRGDATARDVLMLVEVIREKVLKEFGVELEPEIKMLGF